ncbi:MAG: hypothetical protein KBC98_02110, partial [Candidatus Pacebacteria bacterium]|nr:hypothetical protein [Candidatus Paceibacterota bacterium]
MKIFSRISASLFIITLLGFFSFVSVNKVQAAPTCNATTGNWSDPSIWSGACTGVDGIPSSSDSVGIDADVVVTVNTAGAVASSITFWDHQDTVNGINVVSPGTLTVSNQIDLTPMSSDFGNSTIDVGDGTLSVANINIDGDGYGDGFGPVALSVSTGTINVSGDITFSGIAENAQLISTGDSTINIGGSLTSGGTLTTSGTGTINFNGSG